MRLGALFSGGKDSSYAIYLSLQQGFDVVCLITIRPMSPESYMFHCPNIELTQLQAAAMGLPQVLCDTKARKEEELDDLREALEEAKSMAQIEGIISGAIDSDYQKSRIDRVAEETALRTFAPVWRKQPERILEEQIESGFKTIFSGVSAHGLKKQWLGRQLDSAVVTELAALHLKYGINPSGEGGEYETLVLDAPIFKQRLQIDEAEAEWDPKSNSGAFRVLRCHLEPKVPAG